MLITRYSRISLFLIVSLFGYRYLPAQKHDLFSTPQTVTSQLLVAHQNLTGKNYLAFPTLLRLDDEKVLIAFKRGTSHGSDVDADSDAIVFNTVTNQTIDHFTLGSLPGKKFQLTLPMKTPDGKIRLYADMQHQGQDDRNYRIGMYHAELVPGKKTTTAWQKLPETDGVEYGYPFDYIVEGNTVYMLAMSFGYRPGGKWSVAVLRSDDGAETWKFVTDITTALGGGAINESSFVKSGDDFLVVCRGYPPQATRIARFNKEFKLLKVADLTGDDKTTSHYIGWPRVFIRDSQLYVLGRVWPNLPGRPLPSTSMKESQLGLIRINPATFEVEKVALLDNSGTPMAIRDGYYAAPYWQEDHGKTWFNAVTYRAVIGAAAPDIIRLAFHWDEVK